MHRKSKIFHILVAIAILMMTLLAAPEVYAADIEVKSDTDEWYEGNTYYVRNDVTVRLPINVNGKVAVHIEEGATLTAARGIQVNQGSKIDIEGKGKLVTTGDPSSSGAGIGPRYGNPGGEIEINVQPGSSVTVEAYGRGSAAGIGASGGCDPESNITIGGGHGTG